MADYLKIAHRSWPLLGPRYAIDPRKRADQIETITIAEPRKQQS